MPNLIAEPVRSIAFSEQEIALARTAGQALADFDAAGSALTLRLENGQTGENREMMVPAVTDHVLADMLTCLVEGKTMTFIPMHAELSACKAADILNVSSAFFLRLLDEGKMPFRLVGEQHRVRYQDLCLYKGQTQHYCSQPQSRSDGNHRLCRRIRTSCVLRAAMSKIIYAFSFGEKSNPLLKSARKPRNVQDNSR